MKHKLLSFLAGTVIALTGVAAPSLYSHSEPMTASAAVYASDETENYARTVAELVNSERAKQGLPALKYSLTLSQAAQTRAEETVQLFSHTRPNGSSCFTVLKEQGISYTAAGENIAYGQKTPAAVMNAWMNSSGHRANILSKSFDHIGIGVVYRNGTYYWSQMFAASKSLDGETVTTTVTTTSPKVTTSPKTTTAPKVTAAPKTTTAPKVTTAPKTTTAPKVTSAPKTTTTRKAVTAPPQTTAPEVTAPDCNTSNCNSAKTLYERVKCALAALKRCGLYC